MSCTLPNLTGYLKLQLESWPEARQSFETLEKVQIRKISSSGLTLQFNPARIGSTTAKIDAASVSLRHCFLCAESRRQEQMSFNVNDDFELLVNPYPILREHFTVTCKQHQRQSVMACYETMLELAGILPEQYIIFYNGPRSGASAPDHLHLQIGTADGIPLVEKLRTNRLMNTELFTIEPFGFPITIMRHTSPESFKTYYDTLTILDGEYEPRMNIMALNINGEIITVFIHRGKHRPDCYYADGADKRLVSPGAIDMFGLVITPRQEDFEKLTECEILEIYKAVTPRQPRIRVGIMQSEHIHFTLDTPYSDGCRVLCGETDIFVKDGKLLWQEELLDSLTLSPAEGNGRFTLHDVTIGKEFHWQRKERQSFSGILQFIRDANTLWAINTIPVEDYLTSVISSEMNPSAPKEFLKAHAVISRSWVLSQIMPSGCNEPVMQEKTPDRIIKWYDHCQHKLFDVCADDHCQRYQGLSRIDNPNAEKAVRDTFAETLVCDGFLCDTRFSKCCGGVSEQFETCWQNEHRKYLIPVRDTDFRSASVPDLTIEAEAEKWIRSAPPAFCSRPSGNILRQVLNSYDQETTDFYRWSVRYSADTLSELFARKSGIDVGRITAITPVKRGPSGRIYELSVQGTIKSVIIGKELEIRRVLSESHLFSSAFVIDTEQDSDGNAKAFVLTGAGWGHGVGLCQIGAAVMSDNGYNYREILAHYYPNTGIGKFY